MELLDLIGFDLLLSAIQADYQTGVSFRCSRIEDAQQRINHEQHLIKQQIVGAIELCETQ